MMVQPPPCRFEPTHLFIHRTGIGMSDSSQVIFPVPHLHARVDESTTRHQGQGRSLTVRQNAPSRSASHLLSAKKLVPTFALWSMARRRGFPDVSQGHKEGMSMLHCLGEPSHDATKRVSSHQHMKLWLRFLCGSILPFCNDTNVVGPVSFNTDTEVYI